MQATLSPSDLVHGVLVAHIVFRSRDKSNHLWNPMLALCYLSDAIDMPRSRQFESFARLAASFDHVVQVQNGLEDVWQSLLRIDTIDDFSLLVESMRNALLPNTSINFNGLNGPSTITGESKLGVFLRSVLVQWECMQFDGICELFKRMKFFLKGSKTQDSEHGSAIRMNTPYRLLLDDNFKEQAITDTSSGRLELKGNASSFRNNASASLMRGDVAEAEQILHSLIDQNNVDPLWCTFRPVLDAKTPDSPENSSDSGIIRTLLQMLQCDEATRASATKHQHAMLSLARMWLRADNCTMALSAIEEALKTAHQRGDHAAVAQSLFLLHAVFQLSNDPSLVASVEDILLRCTKRSAALDLQYLTAHSALLLVQLRAQQPFQDSANVASEDVTHSATNANLQGNSNRSINSADPSELAIWKVSDIWSQLSFALLGEIALTRQVVSLAGITEDTEFTQSGPSNTMMMGPAAAASAKKENLQDVPMSVCPELVRLSLQASLISSDLYARLGMLQMSEFTCLRSIKQFSSVASVEDMLMVYAKLLHVQVQIAALRSVSSATPCVENVYSQLKRLSKQVRSSLLLSVPFTLSQQWTSVDVLIETRAAQASGDWSKALRLAHRLVELTAGTATGTDREAHPSDTHIDAKMLLAETIARFDLPASLQLMEELAVVCKKNDNHLKYCLCIFLKSHCVLKYASSDDRTSHEALRDIETALMTARKSGYGLFETYLARFSISFSD